MNILYCGFSQMLRQMKKDSTLVIIAFVPAILGIIFKTVIPLIENILTDYFGLNEILAPYYELFDLFLVVITPSLFNYVAAMVILEEADDHITTYLAITPLGKFGYLFSRLGFTGIISFPVSVILVLIFHLSQIPLLMLAGAALTGTVQGIAAGLCVVAMSTNKVEGMAAGKLTSLFNMGLAAPYFVTGKAQYIASILPSFWIAKAVRTSGYGVLLVSISLAVLWMVFLSKKFMKKITG